MDLQTFLEIFKVPMHKLQFISVKLLKKDQTLREKEYFHFIGKFEFVPPDPILNSPDDNKESVLNALKTHIDDGSFVFRKKYTRKIKKGDENNKWVFNYVFDFNPANIMDYELDKENKKMYLYVVGYGTF